ncbi:unnamed protein product [Linum trigynum]|uniref:Uncharacterized protein n=1 Tax=Linum trigynum TaxID=586398 RepID=A0AAV2FZE5_9ROSI
MYLLNSSSSSFGAALLLRFCVPNPGRRRKVIYDSTQFPRHRLLIPSLSAANSFSVLLLTASRSSSNFVFELLAGGSATLIVYSSPFLLRFCVRNPGRRLSHTDRLQRPIPLPSKPQADLSRRIFHPPSLSYKICRGKSTPAD